MIRSQNKKKNANTRVEHYATLLQLYVYSLGSFYPQEGCNWDSVSSDSTHRQLMFRNFHRRLQLDESVFQALNVDKKRSLTLVLGRAYNNQWRTLACEPARTTAPGIFTAVSKDVVLCKSWLLARKVCWENRSISLEIMYGSHVSNLTLYILI